MPRPPSLPEQAVEAQALLREYRRGLAPLWTAAMASGGWVLMSECHALAATLDSSRGMLRRMAGRAEAITCPDGIAKPAHGRAA